MLWNTIHVIPARELWISYITLTTNLRARFPFSERSQNLSGPTKFPASLCLGALILSTRFLLVVFVSNGSQDRTRRVLVVIHWSRAHFHFKVLLLRHRRVHSCNRCLVAVRTGSDEADIHVVVVSSAAVVSGRKVDLSTRQQQRRTLACRRRRYLTLEKCITELHDQPENTSCLSHKIIVFQYFMSGMVTGGFARIQHKHKANGWSFNCFQRRTSEFKTCPWTQITSIV